MPARRRRFVDPITAYTETGTRVPQRGPGKVPSEADLAKETADLTALVRAFQAGVRLGSPPALTPRETEIIILFADDRTVDEIATALTISVYTVRSHVENLRLKYQKRSIAGIVALVLRQGWVE